MQRSRPGFYPWVGKIPWRRARQPTPVFLPGESPWTEEPGRLQSIGSQRVGHNWETKHIHAFKGQAWKAELCERVAIGNISLLFDEKKVQSQYD